MRRCSFLLACLLCACSGGSAEPVPAELPIPTAEAPGGKADSTTKVNTLKLEHGGGKIPLREVSGLALRTLDGKRELLAIGDTELVVARSAFREQDEPSEMEFSRHDLRDVLSAKPPSQWEAIACDTIGRVFILNENPGSVQVFSPKLDSLLHTFELQVDSDGPNWQEELEEQWESEPNSRGEGMVLGSNGHFFILKEKKEPAILEFGPAGDSPVGYSQAFTGTFVVPKDKASEMVPLRLWVFSRSAQDLLPDMSDLFADSDGRLYIVSGDGRMIGRLQESLDPNDTGKLHFKQAWKMSKAIVNPEGLIVAKDGRPWVATDSPHSENLFQLERLDP